VGERLARGTMLDGANRFVAHSPNIGAGNQGASSFGNHSTATPGNAGAILRRQRRGVSDVVLTPVECSARWTLIVPTGTDNLDFSDSRGLHFVQTRWVKVKNDAS
jgi:hypothetical protein